MQLMGLSMVLINILDADIQRIKSSIGFGSVTETCRCDSFCAWSLLSTAPECLAVPNALADVRFERNPYVTGSPAIRSYLSVPLVSSSGARLGTLCIVDRSPRMFSAQDCLLMCNCAELVVRECEARRADERLAYAAAAEGAGEMRGPAAWDAGILVLSIRALLRLRPDPPAMLGQCRSVLVDHPSGQTSFVRYRDSG